MPGGTEPDYGSISVPQKCTADFCLIPLGTPDASVSKQIAEVQRLVRGHPDVKAGKVSWSMHSAGTTLGECLLRQYLGWLGLNLCVSLSLWPLAILHYETFHDAYIDSHRRHLLTLKAAAMANMLQQKAHGPPSRPSSAKRINYFMTRA